MAVIYILGKPGTGKTLLLALFSYMWESFGFKIWSTFGLTEMEHERFDNMEQFDAIKEMGGNHFLALDEGWIMMDARRSQSVENVIMSEQMNQHRKLLCDVAITAQSYRLADVRVREIVDYIMYPRIAKRLDDDPSGVPLYLIVDIYDGFHNFVKKKVFPLRYRGVDIPFAYDTFEKVKRVKNPKHEVRKQLVNKYWQWDGKKTDLVDIMIMEAGELGDDLSKSDASTIAGYILACKRQGMVPEFVEVGLNG